VRASHCAHCGRDPHRRESAHYVPLLPRSEGAIVGSDTGRPLIDGETLRPVTGHDGSLVLEHARVFDARPSRVSVYSPTPQSWPSGGARMGSQRQRSRSPARGRRSPLHHANRPRAKHSLSPGSSLRSSHPPRSGSRFVETSRFPMTARRSRRCHWSLSAEDERDVDPGRLCYGGQARATSQRLGRELREARRGPQDSRRVRPGPRPSFSTLIHDGHCISGGAGVQPRVPCLMLLSRLLIGGVGPLSRGRQPPRHHPGSRPLNCLTDVLRYPSPLLRPRPGYTIRTSRHCLESTPSARIIKRSLDRHSTTIVMTQETSEAG
jgi:hypothetical protein